MRRAAILHPGAESRPQAAAPAPSRPHGAALWLVFCVSVKSYGFGRDKLPNATLRAPPRGTALALYRKSTYFGFDPRRKVLKAFHQFAVEWRVIFEKIAHGFVAAEKITLTNIHHLH